MADEHTVDNGVVSDPESVEAVAAETVQAADRPDTETLKLKQKIEALEKENQESKYRISELSSELEAYKLSKREVESEQSDENKRAFEAVAARALELETQVARLQHDLITAMNDGDEANQEVSKLRKVLLETEGKLEEAKKEKLEMEKKVRELERKVGVLEMKEAEEKSKTLRMEEEMRERVRENESEIAELKKRMVELEGEAGGKAELEEKLRQSELKSSELEGRLLDLQGKAEEAEKVVAGMKENMVHALNGIEIESGATGPEGVKMEHVVAMGSAVTIVAAAAAAYVFYSRRS